MQEERRTTNGWAPTAGSYEEAVLSWYEQVEAAVRRVRGKAKSGAADDSSPREEEPDGNLAAGR